MRAETTLFYDVDTQRDFVQHGGKLFIPGTDRIIPKLAAITELARHYGVRVIASVDRHFPGDPELERNGGDFPDHCMDGTAGQKKIDATRARNPVFVENRDIADDELATILAHRDELIFEKQLFDVFAGNRHAASLLRRILPLFEDVVVYGVYTEVCVRDAIAGLLPMGPQIHIVTDAIADIGSDGDAHRLRWKVAGANLVTVSEITDRIRESTLSDRISPRRTRPR
jgi:nicotinamidase/pyrazinamidase